MAKSGSICQSLVQKLPDRRQKPQHRKCHMNSPRISLSMGSCAVSFCSQFEQLFKCRHRWIIHTNMFFLCGRSFQRIHVHGLICVTEWQKWRWFRDWEILAILERRGGDVMLLFWPFLFLCWHRARVLKGKGLTTSGFFSRLFNSLRLNDWFLCLNRWMVIRHCWLRLLIWLWVQLWMVDNKLWMFEPKSDLEENVKNGCWWVAVFLSLFLISLFLKLCFSFLTAFVQETVT